MGPCPTSFVERSIILCPYLGGSTIGGFTLQANCDHTVTQCVKSLLTTFFSRDIADTRNMVTMFSKSTSASMINKFSTNFGETMNAVNAMLNSICTTCHRVCPLYRGCPLLGVFVVGGSTLTNNLFLRDKSCFPRPCHV